MHWLQIDVEVDKHKTSNFLTLWSLNYHCQIDVQESLFPLPTSSTWPSAHSEKQQRIETLTDKNGVPSRAGKMNETKEWCTLVLPRASVVMHWRIWKIASTKMNMWSWWIPYWDIKATLSLPCKYKNKNTRLIFGNSSTIDSETKISSWKKIFRVASEFQKWFWWKRSRLKHVNELFKEYTPFW